MPTATISAPTTIHSSVSTPRSSLKYPISRFICCSFCSLVHCLSAEAYLPPYPSCQRGSLPTATFHPATRPSRHRVHIKALVRSNINESRALEPDHDFRETLVRDPEDHGISID